MKPSLLLFSCLYIFLFTAYSQSRSIGSVNSVLIANGAFKANEGTIIAIRDTIDHPYKDSIGLLTIRPSDTCLYMSNGLQWIKLARLTDLTNGLKAALLSKNDLSDISDPAKARKNLQLGALSVRDSVSIVDIKGFPDIITLDVITNSSYRTKSPLETSKFVRVKAGSEHTFVDLNHSPLTSWDDPYDPSDTNKIYTITPTSWASNKSVPSLRMRHPLNTFESDYTNNRSLNSDFKILPYEYGWAMEYNGVVECWVGEWSIHKGVAYFDVEGKNNGWGGVLWVGDDLDHGGVRVTARNNPEAKINYGEISVEKFDGAPNGNMHFRLPNTSNAYKWTWGARGDSVTSMILSSQKLEVVNKIETKFIDALSIKTDTLSLGTEGNPGMRLTSIMKNLPENSTHDHFGWLQYNIAGYENLAGSTGYFTRSDIATDHIFFTGTGKPKPSMMLKGNGNLYLGTTSGNYRLDVESENEVTARFSGRVIGANAVAVNEFVTLQQFRDSLKIFQPLMQDVRPGSGGKITKGDTQTSTIFPKNKSNIENRFIKPNEEVLYNTYKGSSNGKSLTIKFKHGQQTAPIWWNVTATSKDAGNLLYVTVDETNIVIHYQSPPPPGVENISYHVVIRPAPINEIKYL